MMLCADMGFNILLAWMTLCFLALLAIPISVMTRTRKDQEEWNKELERIRNELADTR